MVDEQKFDHLSTRVSVFDEMADDSLCPQGRDSVSVVARPWLLPERGCSRRPGWLRATDNRSYRRSLSSSGCSKFTQSSARSARKPIRSLSPCFVSRSICCLSHIPCKIISLKYIPDTVCRLRSFRVNPLCQDSRRKTARSRGVI